MSKKAMKKEGAGSTKRDAAAKTTPLFKNVKKNPEQNEQKSDEKKKELYDLHHEMSQPRQQPTVDCICSAFWLSYARGGGGLAR